MPGVSCAWEASTKCNFGSRADLANLAARQWQAWSATNSPSQRVRFTDPRTATNAYLFYPVRVGP
jgi:hypothetical protein